MNHNYINLNLVFVRQKWKNIFLKFILMFLSEAFQFIIAEKCYIQKQNPFVAM